MALEPGDEVAGTKDLGFFDVSIAWDGFGALLRFRDSDCDVMADNVNGNAA